MPNVATTPNQRPGVPGASHPLLVRVSVDGPGWVRTLPVVPGTSTVTASVSHHDLALVPADDLVGGGYRIVGVCPARARRAYVDLLVDHDLTTEYPRWWRQLLERADRVFDPQHGPVALLLRPVLDLHLGAR